MIIVLVAHATKLMSYVCRKTKMLDTEKEWYIQAPWGRICIVAWGSCGAPPVLLCHGAVDCAVSWRPLLSRLPDKFYYIAMELPGNGKSDPMPKGLMITYHDFVYAIEVVRRHFRWDQFVYMAHSLGTGLGKLYNLSYPGRMSKVIDFDPMPAYFVIEPEQFSEWYHHYFTKYYQKYHIYNSPKENAPKYTREKALSMLKKNRGLTGATAVMVLDRISEPVGDGLVRYTFDQRTKSVVRPPYTAQQLEQFYTNLTTPTLTIIASKSVKQGAYSKTPFALDEKYYPNKNFKVLRVDGTHDVHVTEPEKMATQVSQFLFYGLDGLEARAKL